MTDHNTDILARTVVGEARGEGQPGMEDVALVIMNRVAIAKVYLAAHDKRHPLFGDGSPASACQMPWQFSCWNEGDPNREIIESLTDDMSIFRQALSVAASAISGELPDRTNGATHYKRIGTPAAWAEGKTPCFVQGKHEFFNDIS